MVSHWREYPVKHDILAAHAAGSLMGFIDYWLKEELSPSAEEIRDLSRRLMSASINDVLGRGLDTVERDTSSKSGYYVSQIEAGGK